MSRARPSTAPFRLAPELDNNKVFIVMLSELEGRLDPHFYRPEFKKNIKNVEGFLNDKLGNIARFSDESWDQKSVFSENFPYIEIGEIDLLTGQIKKINNINIQDAPSRAKMIVRSGDILISSTRPNRGAITHLEDLGHDEIYIASTGFSIIREILEKNISKRFLFYWLRQSCSLCQMEQRSSGGNYPAITQEELANIKIPIPPKAIQAQVVEKMDAAYAAKKHKEAQALRLLDSIDDYLLGELGIELPAQQENTLQNRIFTRQLSEVSGGRFDPFFYQNRFLQLNRSLDSIDIPVKKLKEVVVFLDYGLMPTQDYAFSENDGLPMIRVTNISNDGSIDMTDTKYIKYDTPRLYKKIVKSDDILMVQCGNTTGKCAMVPSQYEGYTFGSFSFLIRGNTNIVKQNYLYNVLLSFIVQEQLNKSMTIASVRPNTSKPEVLNLKIPLPPLQKQTAIAKHITAIRNQAKQLQQQAKAELAQAKKEVEAMILGTDNKK